MKIATKLIMTVLVALAAAFLAVSSPMAATPKKAAQAPKPAAEAGALIKTEYFSITIPSGWMMPQEVQDRSNTISAIFANKSGLAVTVNVMQANMTAKDISTQTAENMRKSGLDVSEPEKIGDLYRVSISGKLKGIAWFGSDGKICTATIILGAHPENAGELLGALKPVNPALFPTK